MLRYVFTVHTFFISYECQISQGGMYITADVWQFIIFLNMRWTIRIFSDKY